jgi:hypothetical protein
MDKDDKLEQSEELQHEEELLSRRDFLFGLKKWSKVVIGVAVGGSLVLQDNVADAWWVNRRGWGNRGWGNRGWGNGGWGNRGWGNGGWINRRGGGGWLNVP